MFIAVGAELHCKQTWILFSFESLNIPRGGWTQVWRRRRLISKLSRKYTNTNIQKLKYKHMKYKNTTHVQTYDFSFYTTYFYHIIWFLNRTDRIGIKVTEMNCIWINYMFCEKQSKLSMVHSSKVKAMSGVKELLNWIFCLAASPAFESFQIWIILV